MLASRPQHVQVWAQTNKQYNSYVFVCLAELNVRLVCSDEPNGLSVCSARRRCPIRKVLCLIKVMLLVTSSSLLNRLYHRHCRLANLPALSDK